VTKQRAAAWLVHLYTASGGVLGMLALLAAADSDFRTAFLLLAAAAVIDATDGMLARHVRVTEALPNFDGAMVDNVIDFFTYIWVPVFIIDRAGLLPHPLLVVVPILAGLYAYGQANMKTPDGFFLGFPSHWNVVALYLYWLQPGTLLTTLALVVPGTLTFVPTRYLYPSKSRPLRVPTFVLGAVWTALVLLLLLQPAPDMRLVWLSLLYPLYYLLGSFYVDWRVRRQASA